MAKVTPIIELGLKLSKSKLLGIFDVNEDGKDVVIVDEQEYLFEDIKEYFYGGTIQMSNENLIEE